MWNNNLFCAILTPQINTLGGIAMNLSDSKFSKFALVQEMFQTCDIIKNFMFDQAYNVAALIVEQGRLLITGEGSSRIFPAKNIIYNAARMGCPISIITDGSYQAAEYDLSDYVVFGASNSGQTKELITLFSMLASRGHERRFGLTANKGTRIENVVNKCFVLSCGSEKAVAATKSVVEQALFYKSLLRDIMYVHNKNYCLPGSDSLIKNQAIAAEAAQETLSMTIQDEILEAIEKAPTIYFAGRNDGVAEELTLKTNEITRRKSDFLEGTYLLHGIEEVMRSDDVLILVNPFSSEVEKIKELLVGRVGMKVFAIAQEDTVFPTVKIPQIVGYETILQLLAGWNILASAGIAAGINVDKPERARKIGNEF